jgi:predicted dehydrogenase
MSMTKRRSPTPPKKGPVRIGIVGCGNVMDGAYMPLIQKLQYKDMAKVMGASHTSKARCQAVLDKWEIPRYFESYQELCHSPEVDLVVILTSMNAHAAIAREALLAGKHVMVEKPLAVTLEDAKDLLAKASKTARYLVCAPFTTLSPTFRVIRRRVAAGDVGKVCLARARYGWAGPDWSEWFYRAGSGPIFDLAVYCITSLTGILGPAKRVSAMTGTAVPERFIHKKPVKVQVEDTAQILIDFGDSVFAVVTSGFTMQKYRSPALELYGVNGTIQMLGDDWAPEGYELWQNAIGAWLTYDETDPHWQWTEGLKHLVECIHSGEKPALSPDHALHVLEIMLAAQKSGRTGRAQLIESSFVLPERDGAASDEAAHHRQHDRRRE